MGLCADIGETDAILDIERERERDRERGRVRGGERGRERACGRERERYTQECSYSHPMIESERLLMDAITCCTLLPPISKRSVLAANRASIRADGVRRCSKQMSRLMRIEAGYATYSLCHLQADSFLGQRQTCME